MRLRARGELDGLALRLVTTLVASETARLHAPDRASAAATGEFLHALIVARAARRRRGVVGGRGARRRPRRRRVDARRARARPRDGRRGAPRTRALASSSAARAPRCRARWPRSPSVHELPGDEVVVLLPGSDPDLAERAAESVRRELQAASPATASPSGAAGRAASRPICTAPPARRCSRPTSPRATPSARCWRSTRPAPTGCCSRRCPRTRPSSSASMPRRSSRSSPTTSSTRPTSCTTVEAFLDADGNVAGHRAAAVHAPPHDPLPAGAGARAVRARRRIHRRAREAEPRAQGDARAGHRPPRRPGERGGRRRGSRPEGSLNLCKTACAEAARGAVEVAPGGAERRRTGKTWTGWTVPAGRAKPAAGRATDGGAQAFSGLDGCSIK